MIMTGPELLGFIVHTVPHYYPCDGYVGAQGCNHTE